MLQIFVVHKVERGVSEPPPSYYAHSIFFTLSLSLVPDIWFLPLSNHVCSWPLRTMQQIKSPLAPSAPVSRCLLFSGPLLPSLLRSPVAPVALGPCCPCLLWSPVAAFALVSCCFFCSCPPLPLLLWSPVASFALAACCSLLLRVHFLIPKERDGSYCALFLVVPLFLLIIVILWSILLVVC